MIPYLPRYRWYNRFVGVVIFVGLIWYYLAPTGSAAFTLVAGGLLLAAVAVGAVLQRAEKRRERDGTG
ncbi:MAG: hypothetical protein ACJ8GN_17900 [Longimicrobiaceae bacterium]